MPFPIEKIVMPHELKRNFIQHVNLNPLIREKNIKRRGANGNTVFNYKF